MVTSVFAAPPPLLSERARRIKVPSEARAAGRVCTTPVSSPTGMGPRLDQPRTGQTLMARANEAGRLGDFPKPRG
jgi:hypothetical protein